MTRLNMGLCCSTPSQATKAVRMQRLHRLRLLGFYCVTAALSGRGLGLHVFNGQTHGIFTYEQSVICVSKRTGRIVRIRLSDFVEQKDCIYIVEYSDMSSSMIKRAHRTADQLLLEQVGMTQRHWSTYRSGHVPALCWMEPPRDYALDTLDVVDHTETKSDIQTVKTGEIEMLCPICFDTIVDGEDMTFLQCRHPMHTRCLNEQLGFGLHRCSLCRSDLLTPLRLFRRQSIEPPQPMPPPPPLTFESYSMSLIP